MKSHYARCKEADFNARRDQDTAILQKDYQNLHYNMRIGYCGIWHCAVYARQSAD